MITRITLENFMSHRFTVIEPAAGLTVLTGPNNCGKSAVVTALQTLCTNERGAQMFVRHGEKAARILVETSEGGSVEWKRDGATVSYRVNGRDVHRLRGNTPEDLDDVLSMTPVRAAEGADAFQVHFSEQKQPIFLLNETPGRAATFFASASDTRLLLQMQKLAQDKRRDAKRDEEHLKRRIDEETQKLASYAPVESIDRDVQRLEVAYQDLLDVTATAAALSGLSTKLAEGARRADRLDRESRTLAPLASPPQLADPAPLASILRQSGDASRRLEAATREERQMQGLTPPPPLEPSDALQGAVASMTRTSAYAARLTRRLAAVEPLREPEPLAPTEDLNRFVSMIRQLDAVCVRHSDEQSLLDGLLPPPLPAAVDLLARTVSDLHRAEEALATLESSLEKAQAHLAEALAAVESFVSEHPTCPLCGGPLSPEQVLTGGHAHA